MEKENSQSLLHRDLMVLYPYVASLLGYIDALHIDHDLGCLNMSEVRYALHSCQSCLCNQEVLTIIMTCNFKRVMDEYIFYKHLNGCGSQGTAHVPPVKNYIF